MSEQDPFNRQLIHQEHLQRVVDVAEEQYTTRAAADPQLREFAELQGGLLGQVAQENLADEIPSESSQAEFEWGFTKFVFAFTDPNDHADTISLQAIADLFVEIFKFDENTSTPIVARNFKLLAAHLAIIRFAQSGADIPRGGSADELLTAAYKDFVISLRGGVYGEDSGNNQTDWPVFSSGNNSSGN